MLYADLREDIETEFMRHPAPLADLGHWFQPGDTGRLQRRYSKQSDPSTFDLSHALFGQQQIATLLEFLLLEKNDVEELKLENNCIDDRNLEMLIDGLRRKGGRIRRLNLAYNHLTSAAIDALTPLLKVCCIDQRLPASMPNVQLQFTVASAALRWKKTAVGYKDVPRAIIEKLVLSGNRLGDDGIRLLCQTLLSHSSRLANLELENCGLEESSSLALGELIAGTK